jgi:branched-chain amino acid transport system permease protein
MLGSLSGSLFAHYGSFVNVESFDIQKSIVFLLIPVLGGTNSLTGVLVGAIFVTFLPEFLSSFGQLHQVLFGVALVLVVTALPDGIMGTVGRRLAWRA